jgi:hypothetical protein
MDDFEDMEIDSEEHAFGLKKKIKKNKKTKKPKHEVYCYMSRKNK